MDFLNKLLTYGSKETKMVPKEELGHSGNMALFHYQVHRDTYLNKDAIWKEFLHAEGEESLQLLDNGVLIITEHVFGGRSMISKFTCGLFFCSQLSEYLKGLESEHLKIDVAMGADDYHSGWNYDFNIKIKSEDENSLRVIKDYDFRSELLVNKWAFLKNYKKFSSEIADLFMCIFPDLKNIESFRRFESLVR